MSDRPEWKYEIDRDKFYKLFRAIKKVTHHWEFTSEDTSKNWIELHFEDGKMREPKGFSDVYSFKPDHCCLFSLTYIGERALEDYEEIEKWNKNHKNDIKEYERLKVKLG